MLNLDLQIIFQEINVLSWIFVATQFFVVGSSCSLSFLQFRETSLSREIMAQPAPKLYYWPVKARCVLPVLIWSYGGVKFEWEKNPDWPGLKEKTPFGQLPYVEFGDIHFAQSGNYFEFF